MQYRVIIVKDGKYKSTLYRSRTVASAFKRYHLLKEQNNVIFPKRFLNAKKIKPVKYLICVTKVTEEGDGSRLLRDAMGKTYIEDRLGDWTILAAQDYEYEENFWVYGIDPSVERPTIKEVIKRLMKGVKDKNVIKQVIVIKNKLLIYNEEYFDMILCKNESDAQRLHHTLAKIANKQKIKGLIFMGTATSGNMIYRMYQLIHERTGWKMLKIRRQTTRP